MRGGNRPQVLAGVATGAATILAAFLPGLEQAWLAVAFGSMIIALFIVGGIVTGGMPTSARPTKDPPVQYAPRPQRAKRRRTTQPVEPGGIRFSSIGLLVATTGATLGAFAVFGDGARSGLTPVVSLAAGLGTGFLIPLLSGGRFTVPKVPFSLSAYLVVAFVVPAAARVLFGYGSFSSEYLLGFNIAGIISGIVLALLRRAY